MERLTNSELGFNCDACEYRSPASFGDACERAAIFRFHTIENALGSTYDLSRLKELAELDRSGLLFVIPVPIGTEVVQVKRLYTISPGGFGLKPIPIHCMFNAKMITDWGISVIPTLADAQPKLDEEVVIFEAPQTRPPADLHSGHTAAGL